MLFLKKTFIFRVLIKMAADLVCWISSGPFCIILLQNNLNTGPLNPNMFKILVKMWILMSRMLFIIKLSEHPSYHFNKKVTLLSVFFFTFSCSYLIFLETFNLWLVPVGQAALLWRHFFWMLTMLHVLELVPRIVYHDNIIQVILIQVII